MTDIIVSRIQHRRGKLVDLPQPLRVGELGFCVDSRQLFIGGDPAEMPVGIQILPGQYLYAQSVMDNQILVFEFTSGFNIETLRTNLDLQVQDDRIQVDVGTLTGFVGLSVAQASVPAVVNAIKAIIHATPNVVPLSATMGTGYSVNIGDGSVVVPTHNISTSIATILNSIADPVAVATSLLNIEILTEFSEIDAGAPPPVFAQFSLSASASFVPVGLTYSMVTQNAVNIDYTLHNSGLSSVDAVGTLTIIGNTTTNISNVADDRNFSTTYSPADDIIFSSTVSSGTISLTYKHNYSGSILFKTNSITWDSF